MQRRRDPFTGKWMPVTTKVTDVINPVTIKPSHQQEKEAALVETAHKLAQMRQEYSRLLPADRAGRAGVRMTKEYRRLSHVFWHLTGKHPPRIYDDL